MSKTMARGCCRPRSSRFWARCCTTGATRWTHSTTSLWLPAIAMAKVRTIFRLLSFFFVAHACAAFLGYVDMHGSNYTDETVATGYGAHIARPLLRKFYRPDLTKDEALKVRGRLRVLSMCQR